MTAKKGLSTKEYIEHEKREVLKINIRMLVANTPEEIEKLKKDKAKREQTIEALSKIWGKSGRGEIETEIMPECRAFSSDGSIMKPEIEFY